MREGWSWGKVGRMGEGREGCVEGGREGRVKELGWRVAVFVPKFHCH